MAFSFGQLAQQQQQAAKPTFSFGAPAASTSQPAASTTSGTPSFSFGNTNNTTTQNNQQPTLSFGQPQQQQAAAPAATGGFSFGNSSTTQNNNNNTQQAGTTGGFSFGGLGAKPAGQASSTTAAPSFSFGNTSTNQQQQQASKPTFGFGASTSAPATNAFGLSTNQNQQQQQPAQQQQNQLGASASTTSGPITKSTRFEDLPENERRQIEAIEQHIQGRIAIYDSLKNQDLGMNITETRVLLRDLIGEFAALQNHLAHDHRATTVLKTRFERSIKDGANAAQIVNNFRAPPNSSQPSGAGQSQQSPKANPAFLQEFFRRKAEELASRLETYKSSIEQIQSQLSRSDPDQVKAILPTLKAQHAATLQLAGKLSSLEGSVTELRDEYRDLWRERTGSVRDPFIERRRQVLGVEDGVLDSVGGLSIR